VVGNPHLNLLVAQLGLS